MKVAPTAIADLLIIDHKVFWDDRGFFFESFNQRRFAELTGIDAEFVQDNHSRSARHVLRGLHYQIQHPQGKLVRVVEGEVSNSEKIVLSLPKKWKKMDANKWKVLDAD